MFQKQKVRDTEYFKKHFHSQQERFLEEFFTFLRFETISADPAKLHQLASCAQWLEIMLSNAGFQVELWNRDSAPIVFAKHMQAGPDKPTLLIYNHYDVQPVDPLELWATDPFSPVKDGPLIYARGAQDNKGQCFYVMAALISYLQHEKKFPINIKYIIEGEEESGSEGLNRILQEKKDELRADHAIIVDLGQRSALTPAITLGTRGIIGLQLDVEGTDVDLHSGSHGGLAFNPLHALIELLAKARGDNGHITIPGFYDDVHYPDDEVLAKMNFDFDSQAYLDQFGALPTGGEKSYTPLERNWLRPTLEINGLGGGYQGPGGKTVIPAKAFAKITCRLVPNQNPLKVARRIKAFFESSAPLGTKASVTINEGHAGCAVRCSAKSPITRALEKSLEQVFWQKCEYIFEGASIPIVPALQKTTGADIAMFGLGLAEDRIHAPNESFGWDRVEKGFLTISTLIDILGSNHN